MKRILLTGGSGYIGSHTCLVLLEKGYEIIVIDSHVNSSSNSIERVIELVRLKNNDYAGNVELIEGDVRDSKLLDNIFSNSKDEGKKIDGVIHFAGLKSVSESVDKPLIYWDSNVNGTISLLKTMEAFECYNLIFSSSATIYGYSDTLFLNEESEVNPINPYGTTKSSIEKLLNDLFNASPHLWKIAILRYFNPIGAHQSGKIGEEPVANLNNIFPIITRVASGQIKQFKVYGNDWNTPDGTGVRDYIHVMDLAEGHVSALEYLLNHKTQLLNLNLGTGKGTSVLELINTFEAVNNVKIPYIFDERRAGDIASIIASNDLALSILNWCPKRTLIDMCKDGWSWQLYRNKFFNLE
tara:strand:- start:95 stop:1156 length:1062 start_codon:yes stop_codon:yes gene_type:complete